ncbi:MAG: DUF2007 domain-containing protein [Planctomycetes bacterium]|nr:DUF2007 domain-containing protein [Planctomycetota bacterium]
MADDPKRPIALTTVPTEVQAALIVAALEDEGIEARAIGEMTTGYRAEAPGEVQILIHQADAARAREILRELEGEHSEEE